jgi:glycosyltransferase involved in cell wall biosynthesis
MFNRTFIVGCVGAKQDKLDYKGFNLIKKACSELGLELKIAQTRFFDEMPHFYNTIDCLVVASIAEGCHNPTLEMLAMNKPVISTDVGIADMLDGVIIVDRNINSIKKALLKLMGRTQILEKYTWKIIAEKYKLLYLQYAKGN